MAGHFAVVGVVDLVLQRGPEVHGHSPDLDFHVDELGAIGEKHRYLQNHMQALVAVELGRTNIVLDLHHAQIRLRAQHLRHPVGVGDEAAGNADPGDVADGVPDGLQRGLAAIALYLVQNSVKGLQPVVHVLDGGVVPGVFELFAQHIDLGQHFIHAELIVQLELGELAANIDHPIDRVSGTVLIGFAVKLIQQLTVEVGVALLR